MVFGLDKNFFRKNSPKDNKDESFEPSEKKVEKKLLTSEDKKKYFKELSETTSSLGNNLDMISFGKDDLESTGIREDVLSQMTDDGKDNLNSWVEAMEKFVTSPVFTDDFHQDHHKRREWENELFPKISQELQEYYGSNRLGFNNIQVIIAWSKLVMEDIKAPFVKKDLESLVGQFPQDCLLDDKGYAPYNGRDDAHKVADVYKMTAVVNAILNYLKPLNKN